MCSRVVNPIEQPHTLTAKDITNATSGIQFDLISYCGNDGDPLMARDLLKIVRRFAPTHQMIHTNGSLRSKDFWLDLATIPNLTVVFAIDGTDQETHSTYRVGTDYNKILSNAKIFNDAGGTSWWQFIMFEHNRHQVEDARSIAKQYGFTQFEMVHSRRDDTSNIKTIKFLGRKGSDTVKCLAIENQKIYVRSDGEVFPCVYRGNRGESTGLNIKNTHLKDIVFDPYFDRFDFTHPICQYNCKDMIRNRRDKTSIR